MPSKDDLVTDFDGADKWLVLAQARLDAKQALRLISKFGCIDAVVSASYRSLAAAGINEVAAQRILRPNRESIECALRWLDQKNHHLLPFTAADYPQLLSEIANPPAVLYLEGQPAALHLPLLAIVGSRNPTSGGTRNAYQFSQHLSRHGFAIASGLAQGIDTAAHEGALAANATTVAFLGHGIDRIYPRQNIQLARRIVEAGALVSEYPLGSPPRPEHFPARNRLISGCSVGTLVVEAAHRSGSLITARLAAEQGREVFAIPGSIHNAMSRGCHRLIGQGATLVETAADIASELGALNSHLMQNANSEKSTASVSRYRDDDYKLLIMTLGHDPMTADQLSEKSGLTIERVSSMLLILVLDGDVEALRGGQYSLLGRSSWHERKRTRRSDVSI